MRTVETVGAEADLTRLSLVEASAALAAGTASSTALTEAYLARIFAIDPAVNAYVTVTADRARRDARRADAELRAGHRRGPLHGLPIGIKDLFDTAGIPTTAGSALRRGHVPATDSAVAARLRRAGAVLLGKHATHEFAWGGTTNNPHYGPTRNPYALGRIPGGSSGGSAAAVVARTALASVGTDTCGSVRIPAALSGCVGLKPTYGWTDLTGTVPLAPSLDHAGPIARTPGDAALLYQVLAGNPGPDRPPAASPPADLRTGLRAGLRVGLRVGLLRGWFAKVIDPETAAAVDITAQRLAERGCVVVELDAPDVGPVVDRVFDIVRAEAGPYHREDFRRSPEAYGADLRAVLSLPPPTATELAAGRRLLDRLTGWLTGALDRADRRGPAVDVLLSATTPAPAPLIGEHRVGVGGQVLHIEWMLTRLTSIFNVAGLPALSVPVGVSRAGLPLGAQVIGRPWAETTVLSVGQAAHQLIPEPAFTPAV